MFWYPYCINKQLAPFFKQIHTYKCITFIFMKTIGTHNGVVHLIPIPEVALSISVVIDAILQLFLCPSFLSLVPGQILVRSHYSGLQEREKAAEEQTAVAAAACGRVSEIRVQFRIM